MTTTDPQRSLTALPTPPGPRIPAILQVLLYPYRHRVIPLLRRRYGDVVAISLLGRPSVQLCTPELNRTVFAGDVTVFHAGEGNRVLASVLGEHSVLTTDEQQHRRLRALLMPPFHGSAMRGYRDLMERLANAEAATWPTGSSIAAHRRMNAITLEIIVQVVFGVADGPRLEALRGAVTHLVTAPTYIFLGEVITPLQRFGPWKRFERVLDRIDELLYAEIADRRTAPDLAERTDVLSRLLAVDAGDDRLSDVELRDQMLTLLLAGHETTATTLAWTLHDLAHDPDLQARVVEAVDAGDDRYLDAVVKESMRLHPVIYAVARTVTEDVELGGHRIPAGHTVLPGIGPVHADPAHHADPEIFRPERFLDGSATPANWLPFGGGARRCIGAGFALLEATTILRAVLSRYTLSAPRPSREGTRARHITLAPSRGARVVLHRR